MNQKLGAFSLGIPAGHGINAAWHVSCGQNKCTSSYDPDFIWRQRTKSITPSQGLLALTVGSRHHGNTNSRPIAGIRSWLKVLWSHFKYFVHAGGLEDLGMHHFGIPKTNKTISEEKCWFCQKFWLCGVVSCPCRTPVDLWLLAYLPSNQQLVEHIF